MTSFHERARAQADRMLAPKSRGGKGQVVTLIGLAVGPYDTGDATADVTEQGKQYGSGIEEAYDASRIDGTLIRVGDRRFFMSTARLNADGRPQGGRLGEPVVDQTIVAFADKKEWMVKSVDRLAPAGLPITYTLQLRRS